MAYIDCDPFDNYTDITTRWDIVTQPNSPFIVLSSVSARFPAPSPLTGQGAKFTQNCNAIKNLPGNYARVIAGIACAPPTLSVAGFGGWQPIWEWRDAGTVQLTLAFNSLGALQFFRGQPAANPVGSPSANGVITAGSYPFFEVDFTIDPSAGIVKLWVNQPSGATPLINSTGLNTRASANSFANQIRIGDWSNTGSGNGIKYDDLYIFDGSGSTQNAQLGDSRLLTKMPNGAGSSSQWTDVGSTGSGCVSSIPPDATKYISDNTAGHVELYAMQSAGLAVPANFVVIRRQHLKDDAAAHTDQSKIKSVAATAVSGAVTVPSTATYQDDIFVNDPNTGNPWASGTAGAADTIEVGVVETS